MRTDWLSLDTVTISWSNAGFPPIRTQMKKQRGTSWGRSASACMHSSRIRRRDTRRSERGSRYSHLHTQGLFKQQFRAVWIMGSSSSSPPGWRQQAEGEPARAGGEAEGLRGSRREQGQEHRGAAEAAGGDGAGERHPEGDHPQPRGGTPRAAQDQRGRPERGREVSSDRFTHISSSSRSKNCLFWLRCVWTSRAEQLEKEVAILREKIHHLDDMLKSQQRKVRHMIEQVRRTCARQTSWSPSSYLCRISDCLPVCSSRLQLQNSRMVIQERDRVILELEEKVAFLEAEVSFACLLETFYWGVNWNSETKGQSEAPVRQEVSLQTERKQEEATVHKTH